ncbi:hypothetical protein ABW21_db0200181 [Orbilia brochopaga]|nr:hypothetical protein ABW21_db0200181 [Drechslerella brochopaga]
MKPPLPRLRCLPRRPPTLPQHLIRRNAFHNDHSPTNQRPDRPQQHRPYPNRQQTQRQQAQNPPFDPRYRDLAYNKSRPDKNRYINHHESPILHLDPMRIGRSAQTIFRCPLFFIQYSSAILLLSAHSILVNPFHPLLRASLNRHAETHDLGYFFHLHTSSKTFTGRESHVRKAIRGKVRTAWETALTSRGYDVKTGRFVKHLQADWDPTKQIRQQDIRGTISINPNEACWRASFKDLVANFERGLDVVLACRRKDPAMEHMMQPESLYKFYEHRRSSLLRKYTNMGYGLTINGEAAANFRDAVNNREQGGQNGPQLVQVDGQTYDVGSLKISDDRKKVGLVLPDELDDDEIVASQSGSSDKLPGGISSSDLDWGLDDIGLIGASDAAPERGQKKGKGQRKGSRESSNAGRADRRGSLSVPVDDGF